MNPNKSIDIVTSIGNHHKNILSKKQKALCGSNIDENVLREMRQIHGRVILEIHKFKDQIKSNPSEQNLYDLSFAESLLCVIHTKIRKTEKRLHRKNILHQSSSAKSVSSVGSNMSMGSDMGMRDKTEVFEFSARRIEDNTLTPLLLREKSDKEEKSYVPPKSRKIWGGDDSEFESESLTSYIENMTDSEAAKYVKLDSVVLSGGAGEPEASVVNSTYDLNKPTVVNYWAQWCGFSREFIPEWEKFQNECKNALSNVQVYDIDVSRGKSTNDPELQEIASSIGVTGYPTCIIYDGSKTHKIICGRMKSDTLMKEVKKCLKI